VRPDAIRELAVVELEHDQNGNRERAYGVVLNAAPDEDAYLVELVDRHGGKHLIIASASDLHVRNARLTNDDTLC
jgi:hypothetical protein